MVRRRLHIDIETYSSVDLKEHGIYKYVESPDFEILWFAYAYDDDSVIKIDCTESWPPVAVLMDLTNRFVEKVAFNAQFERICLTKYTGRWPHFLPVEQWTDTMILASELGYPRDLDTLGQALNDEKFQKDKRGKALIQYFSKPCKPTKANGGRTRNMPEHAPDRWATYGDYCGQDVVTEREGERKLLRLGDMHPREWKYWHVDQRINDRGFRVDRTLVNSVVAFRDDYQDRVFRRIVRLTKIDNPNSPTQVKAWLKSRGFDLPSIGKDFVKEEIELLESKDNRTKDEDDVLKFLKLRQMSALSSLKKYDKINGVIENDTRVRGCFAFHGAQRTGREAGRLVQIQNLPRNDEDLDLDTVRTLVRGGEWAELTTYAREHDGDALDYCKQLIRTSIVPQPGKKIVVADFSNIEARVIAWLADEKWRIEVFKSGQGIYETSASQMFDVPAELINKDNAEYYPLRQKGKTAELALGFQGAVGAMRRMDKDGKIRPDDLSDRAARAYARANGIDKVAVRAYMRRTGTPKYKLGKTLDEAILYVAREGMIDANYQDIIDRWRAASPKIVDLWTTFENAAKKAIRQQTSVSTVRGIVFSYSAGTLWIKLPSGRRLAYPKASVKSHMTQWGKPRKTIFYRGKNEDETTRKGFSKKWGELETYGGKITENIVQAVARDLLFRALHKIDATDNPFDIIGHVHDEIIAECSTMSEAGPDDLAALMTGLPPWANDDLVLGAAGFESQYYKKD